MRTAGAAPATLTEVAQNTVGDQAWQADCHQRVLGQPSNNSPAALLPFFALIPHAGMRIANLSGTAAV